LALFPKRGETAKQAGNRAGVDAALAIERHVRPEISLEPRTATRQRQGSARYVGAPSIPEDNF